MEAISGKNKRLGDIDAEIYETKFMML